MNIFIVFFIVFGICSTGLLLAAVMVNNVDRDQEDMDQLKYIESYKKSMTSKCHN